jgi:hypothetical protein
MAPGWMRSCRRGIAAGAGRPGGQLGPDGAVFLIDGPSQLLKARLLALGPDPLASLAGLGIGRPQALILHAEQRQSIRGIAVPHCEVPAGLTRQPFQSVEKACLWVSVSIRLLSNDIEARPKKPVATVPVSTSRPVRVILTAGASAPLLAGPGHNAQKVLEFRNNAM